MSDVKYAECREPGCEWRHQVADEREFLKVFSDHYRAEHTDRTNVKVLKPGAAI